MISIFLILIKRKIFLNLINNSSLLNYFMIVSIMKCIYEFFIRNKSGREKERNITHLYCQCVYKTYTLNAAVGHGILMAPMEQIEESPINTM